MPFIATKFLASVFDPPNAETSQLDNKHAVDPQTNCLHASEVMTLSSGSGSDPFSDIRKRFIERCRSDLPRLQEFRSVGVGNPDALSALTRIAHALAGAGGTFGYPEISDKAFALESLLIEGDDNRAIPALDELIQALQKISASSD